jgi:hypothetical protein
MGSCLPSAREVLIIRPTGKKRVNRINAPAGMPINLPGPCQEAEHSEAGSESNAVQCGMQ